MHFKHANHGWTPSKSVEQVEAALLRRPDGNQCSRCERPLPACARCGRLLSCETARERHERQCAKPCAPGVGVEAPDAVRRLMDAAHVFVTYASVTDSNPTLRAEANVWLERYRALVRSEGAEVSR